jgi:Cu/Ag efflux protein CusF
MRTILSLALAVFAASAAGPVAAQQPDAKAAGVTVTSPGKGTTVNTVKITASVEAVDYANRTVTLKGPRGNVVTLEVGPEVRNFDQVKAGDSVVVRYVEALSLELKKGGTGVTERVESEGSARAQPGERPAAGAAREVRVLANVIAVNRKKHTVTLRGPKQTVELKVRDPKQLKLVKVGDQVEATYTEAIAISVEPAAK